MTMTAQAPDFTGADAARPVPEMRQRAFSRRPCYVCEKAVGAGQDLRFPFRAG